MFDKSCSHFLSTKSNAKTLPYNKGAKLTTFSYSGAICIVFYILKTCVCKQSVRKKRKTKTPKVVFTKAE